MGNYGGFYVNAINGKVAIITGGDSGIGRAVAYAFALEGADILIAYFNEHKDAEKTKKTVEASFRTNIFSQFYLTQAALPHLIKSRGSIINTISVTA
jgi:NAD(P)-dependent dehydrogenase (short-subunit alcohol dehydrogenase family)